MTDQDDGPSSKARAKVVALASECTESLVAACMLARLQDVH